MKIIYSPRRSGKTTEIIKRCAEQGGVILVPTRMMADMLIMMAADMGLEIPMPITAFDVKNDRHMARNIEKLHIDNAELVLQAICRVPISTLSLTETKICASCGEITEFVNYKDSGKDRSECVKCGEAVAV
ncbi:hypothetical protein LCGC14_1759430 [marine sediment metagenome]|uniref:Uncharacterized protein n=1 Tax=marine sediment metagenome TaxID=412755 RepID=A0A0F9H1L8_9ZZZZ